LICCHYKKYILLTVINLTPFLPLSLLRRGGDAKINNTFSRIFLLKNERKPPYSVSHPLPTGQGIYSFEMWNRRAKAPQKYGV
jgi:hypothetical protein